MVEKFAAIYETRRFITVSSGAGYWSLSWARRILLHLHLGLLSGLFPSGFPTKTLYTFIIYPMHDTYLAHLILLDLITLIIFGDERNYDTPQ